MTNGRAKGTANSSDSTCLGLSTPALAAAQVEAMPHKPQHMCDCIKTARPSGMLSFQAALVTTVPIAPASSDRPRDSWPR